MNLCGMPEIRIKTPPVLNIISNGIEKNMYLLMDNW